MKSQLFNTFHENVGNPAGTSAPEENAQLDISASAGDVNRLRGHVNDLSIPYVEVRFNARLREIEKRWPLYALNLSVICKQAAGNSKEPSCE